MFSAVWGGSRGIGVEVDQLHSAAGHAGGRDLGLRPVAADDSGFLARLYAAVRAPELEAFGWSSEQFTAFCAMQLRFRDTGYAQYQPATQTAVVTWAGAPVGRLDVSRGSACWQLVNVELMPHARGQGLGTLLVHWLQKQASEHGVGLRLRVAHGNPAVHLYLRCGFAMQADGGDGFVQELEWNGCVPVEDR